MMRAALLLLLASSLLPGIQAAIFTTPNCATGDKKAPRIDRKGEYKTGFYGGSGVEVLAYSNYKGAAIVAVVESNPNSSGVRLLDVTNIEAPTFLMFLASPYGYPNSVSFHDNVLAIACDGSVKTDAGWVLLYTLDISRDPVTGKQKVAESPSRQDISLIESGAVCAMPDMITWNEKGNKLYTACEGEPSTQEVAYSDPLDGANPAGAIGVVNVAWAPGGGVASASVGKVISIQAYINSLSAAQYAKLLDSGLQIDVRITQADAAKDIEPEYIALSDDGRTLYCTLQENNAILVVDLATEKVVNIWPLGLKDWSQVGIDINDEDKVPQIKTYPNLKGLYQPDTIVYKKIRGRGYLFIANEGDAKEEKVRVKDLAKDLAKWMPIRFPGWTANLTNYASLNPSGSLNRINVNPSCGLIDRNKPALGFKYFCTYGARSFAILNAETGQMIFDSGSQFETKISQLKPDCFNCDRAENKLEARSDDSGPEPEAMEVMELNGRFFALIGLERQSGFMIYDVTDPYRPTFIQWWTHRDFTKGLSIGEKGPGDAPIMGDLAPEMIKFIPGHKSHTHKALLLVTNEYSASVTLHTVEPCKGSSQPTV